jgi:hypothetical protein
MSRSFFFISIVVVLALEAAILIVAGIRKKEKGRFSYREAFYEFPSIKKSPGAQLIGTGCILFGIGFLVFLSYLRWI